MVSKEHLMKKAYIIMILVLTLLIQNVFSREKKEYTIGKLAEGIYELSMDEWGFPVKVIVSVGDDGILIVDSGTQSYGDALVEALNTFNKGMPKIIINTHSHNEHLAGNIAVGKGAVIIGHRNLRDRYVNGLYVFNGIPEYALPNVTFTDSLSLWFNGQEVRLIAFPGAHDNSDIIAWFTGSKVVCTGALCCNHHFPSMDGELDDIRKYPETVEKIISILPGDAIIVPGHSKDCTMNEFREFHDMLVQTSGIIRTEMAKGKGLDRLREEDILAGWSTWESYVSRNDWIGYWYHAISNPRESSTKMKVYAPVYHIIMQYGADSAISLYNNLKTLHSDQYWFEERTSMWIGRRLIYIGRNDDAVKFLNLCIREYPDHDAAYISHCSLGNIYWDSDDKKSAKEHYEIYLKRFPNDTDIVDRVKEMEKEMK
jgi:cyclase